MTVTEALQGMVAAFDPEQAKGINAVVQLNTTGEGGGQLVVLTVSFPFEPSGYCFETRRRHATHVSGLSDPPRAAVSQGHITALSACFQRPEPAG